MRFISNCSILTTMMFQNKVTLRCEQLCSKADETQLKMIPTLHVCTYCIKPYGHAFNLTARTLSSLIFNLKVLLYITISRAMKLLYWQSYGENNLYRWIMLPFFLIRADKFECINWNSYSLSGRSSQPNLMWSSNSLWKVWHNNILQCAFWQD